MKLIEDCRITIIMKFIYSTGNMILNTIWLRTLFDWQKIKSNKFSNIRFYLLRFSITTYITGNHTWLLLYFYSHKKKNFTFGKLFWTATVFQSGAKI